MAVFIFCVILYFIFIINILLIFRQPKIHFTCMWVWTSYKAWTISLEQSVGMQQYTACWIRVWRIAWRVSSWVRLANTCTWWVMQLKAKFTLNPFLRAVRTTDLKQTLQACFASDHTNLCYWIIQVCGNITPVWGLRSSGLLCVVEW
jgi:hypothetical protein